MSSPERLLVPDAELSRPALVLAQRFVQRWDLYAHQVDDGSYVCVHELLNVGLLFGHLRSEITLGTYLLNQEGRARFLVLDADDAQGWERLGCLARVLAGEGIPAYLERSRRGGHLWLFLVQAVAGSEARAFGLGLLRAHQVEEVELFSKQDGLAEGPGSLIRMPFGVHCVFRSSRPRVPGMSARWQVDQSAFQLTSPAPDGLLVQTGDLRQFAITGTTPGLGQQARVPTTLWLIQAAHKQVHLSVEPSNLGISLSFANVTFALVNDQFDFLGHERCLR